MKRILRMIAVTVIAFLLVFTGFIPAGKTTVHADDYPEMGVNDVKKGTLTKDKDKDIYKINVPSDGYLKFDLTAVDEVSIQLYNSQNTDYYPESYASATRTTDPNLSSDFTATKEVSIYAGTYYLHVNGTIRDAETYTIKTSFEAAGNDQTTHTNKDDEHALPVQTGQTVNGFGSGIDFHSEYYTLNLNAPARLRLTFTSEENNELRFDNFTLDLRAEDGKRGAPQTVSGVVVADIGTHSIEISYPQSRYSFKVEEDPVITMYRAYNPNSGEHFYTSNQKEFNHIVSLGWRNEGVGWIAPQTSETPVYRLYNKNGGEHHYTTDNHERSALIMKGWTDEGIGWYSDDLHTVPLYREYNPNAFANNHNYTTSEKEDMYLVSIGWRNEGTGWYAVRAQ